jgi:hypothetical protein
MACLQQQLEEGRKSLTGNICYRCRRPIIAWEPYDFDAAYQFGYLYLPPKEILREAARNYKGPLKLTFESPDIAMDNEMKEMRWRREFRKMMVLEAFGGERQSKNITTTPASPMHSTNTPDPAVRTGGYFDVTRDRLVYTVTTANRCGAMHTSANREASCSSTGQSGLEVNEWVAVRTSEQISNEMGGKEAELPEDEDWEMISALRLT